MCQEFWSLMTKNNYTAKNYFKQWLILLFIILLNKYETYQINDTNHCIKYLKNIETHV